MAVPDAAVVVSARGHRNWKSAIDSIISAALFSNSGGAGRLLRS